MPPEGVNGDASVGTAMVIVQGVTVDDARSGRILSDSLGVSIRKLVKENWRGRTVFDTTIKCPGGAGLKAAKGQEPDARCLPYLKKTFVEVEPDRILVFGRWAAKTLLGRSIDPLETRKNYSWIKHPSGRVVPLFVLMDPADCVNNKHLRRWLKEDVKWALSVDPADLFPDLEDAVFHIVENAQDAREAEARLEQGNWVAYDVETAGKQFSDFFEMLCVSFTPDDEDTAYVWGPTAMEDPEAVRIMCRMVENKTLGKVSANGKYEGLSFRAKYSVIPRGNVLDIQLCRRMDFPGVDASLGTLAEMLGMGGYKQAFEKEHRAKSKALITKARQKSKGGKQLFLLKPDPILQAALDHPDEDDETYAYGLVPSPHLERYNAQDTVCTARGAKGPFGFRMLKQKHHRHFWKNLQGKMSDAVEQIEAWGMPVDRGACEVLRNHLDAELARVEKRFEAYKVSPTSTQQLSALIFDKLGLRNPHDKPGQAPNRSTDGEALRAMAGMHPIIDDLREHRRLFTHRKNWGKLASYIRSDGRIHPSLKIDGTECMPRGELVLTARGYLPVEKVKVGDQVISHTGVPRKVVRTVENAPAPIVEVTLSNGLCLRTTRNHEYHTPTGWVAPTALKVGDLVTVHADKERWKTIPGWSDFMVSSWGRVVNTKTGRYLTQRPKGKWGHLKVTLYRNGAQKRGPDRKDFAVHRLVADAFCAGRSAERHEVRHLNGIAWDNSSRNLAWVTTQENSDDAVRHGTRLTRASAQRKLTDAQVEEIREKALGFRTDQDIADEYNVCRELVGHIRRGARHPKREIHPPRADFYTASVVSVREASPQVTYGLTVEVDHSHVTAGIVTHNTGRLSCVDPPMHGAPRPKDAQGHTEGKLIRSCIAAAPGRLIKVYDYSQLEYRVAAILSGDQVMKRLFIEGGDIHWSTARMISQMYWGIPPDKVESNHRSATKAFNFSLIYGKVDTTIARELGIPLERAVELRRAIMGEWKDLAAWMKEVTDYGYKTGQVVVKLDLEPALIRQIWQIGYEIPWSPDLTPQQKAQRGEQNTAKNSCVNTSCQGAGALIMNRAITRIVPELVHGTVDAKLCLTVHDSVIFDVAEDDSEKLDAIVYGHMLDVESRGVPIVVDCEAGPNWGNLEKQKKVA